MPTFTYQVATAGLSVLLLAAAVPAQTTDQAASPAGSSKVRIVRLSEVRGAVQVDRNTGRGFEPAVANLPIVEQSRVQTGVGVAEVEFEDNSTLRLAPDSLVEFPQLVRLASGSTASSVHLLKGTAYVSLVKTQGSEFNLLFGQRNLQLPPSSHIRLQVQGSEAKLAVLDGTVKIAEQSGSIDVPRKKTVTFKMLDEAQPTVAKDIAPDAFDSWDHDAAGYHARTASLSAFGNSPYSYGVNDMMYYGSFMNAGGCGSMWRPYFASAAWDPYSNGVMAYYPGAGYSWVSPYPWGWTPYHYGNWSFCQGTGWGWQPGGSWSGLNNIASFASVSSMQGQRQGRGRIPVLPIHPPKAGEPTMLAVNSRPLVRSEVGSRDSFVFRKDSAGLGIPRDGLGKLGKFSQRAVDRGTSTTSIYVNAPAMPGANGRAASTATVANSVHRGSPPSASSNASSYGGQSSNAGSTRSVSSGSQPRSSAPAPSPSHNH